MINIGYVGREPGRYMYCIYLSLVLLVIFVETSCQDLVNRRVLFTKTKKKYVFCRFKSSYYLCADNGVFFVPFKIMISCIHEAVYFCFFVFIHVFSLLKLPIIVFIVKIPNNCCYRCFTVISLFLIFNIWSLVGV